jgi:hypothetical protein
MPHNLENQKKKVAKDKEGCRPSVVIEYSQGRKYGHLVPLKSE